jgi:glutathione S-transferase
MIELIQFPWSPYCLVQRRILEYSGVRFKSTNLPRTGDRSVVWRLTKEQSYGVPLIRDGSRVVFESGEETQDIAKYLDQKLQLGLFPPELEGLQSILWRYIENEVEDVTFRLNDAHFREFVVKGDQVFYVRHKERKFGRGCLELWRKTAPELLQKLERNLLPLEQMLQSTPFLLGPRPRFVDFELFGMLENLLFSGHYQLPGSVVNIQNWHRRLATLKIVPPSK